MSNTHTTCIEALAAWDNGETLTVVSIGGMGKGYEQGCQALMFEAIRQHIEHEGDAVFWDSVVGTDSSKLFSNASQLADEQGMTGAMWGGAVSAAVVMLRNTWAGGTAMAPADRLIEIARVIDEPPDPA